MRGKPKKQLRPVMKDWYKPTKKGAEARRLLSDNVVLPYDDKSL